MDKENENKDLVVSKGDMIKLNEIFKDSDIEQYEIKKLDDKNFIIRTPKWTWRSLCGREWSVNIETGKVTLTCLN